MTIPLNESLDATPTAAPAGPESHGPQIDIKRALTSHKKLAVLVFLVIAIPGIFLAQRKGKPYYVSMASVQVNPQFLKTLEDDVEMQRQAANYRYFLQQQALNITRYEFLEEALRRLGDDRYLWQRSYESDFNAIVRLQQTIDVEAVHGSYLVTVGLTGSQPTGLADLVNAVVEVYLDNQAGEFFYAEEDQMQTLEQHRADVEEEIKYFVRAKSELAAELGVSDFSDSAVNPNEQALNETSAVLHAAHRDRLRAEAERDALKTSHQSLGQLELDSQARLSLRDGAADPATAPMAERLGVLLADVAGLTPEHPGYRSTWDQINEIEAFWERNLEESVGETKELLALRRETTQQEELSRAEGRVLQHRAFVQAMETELDRLRETASEFIIKYEKGREYERNIERLNSRIIRIENREDYFSTESGSPGFARLLSKARTPEVPIGDRRMKYSFAFLVIALAMGLGSGFVVEFLDRRIHSAKELERALGFPPLAWIAERADERGERLADDQLRRLALSLRREVQRGSSRRIVFTAAAAGVGSTRLVQELGAELQSIGVKTLTVDANAMNDTVSTGEVGLIDLLEGGTDPHSAIRKGKPDHLPLGAGIGQHRLPTPHRLDELFARIGKDYDLLLVDAPPLILSSDAELIVGCADTALFVVGASRNDINVVRHALAKLERLAPPAVAVLLNRVQSAREKRSLGVG